MHNLKTGDSFEQDGYKITRIGAGAEGSKSDWALMCIERSDDISCVGSEGECDRVRIHTWIKKGHCFSAGNNAYRLEDSNREDSCIIEAEPGETGIDVS